MWSISKYTISLALLAAVSGPARAQKAVKDSLQTAHLHQLRVGFDLGRIVLNASDPAKTGYDFSADYYFRKELYFVAEGGFGNSSLAYTDLSYTTSNYYIRLGVDKMMVPRIAKSDWDGIFFGARYAMAGVQRATATYTIADPLYGSISGSIPSHSFTAHWAEATAGIRLNLYKGLMTGWNVRGKFLLNGTAFRELPPAYIAGYGKGDNSTAFDFNVYLLYAFRWGN